MEGRPLEDAELIELAKTGDADAYGILVGRYQDVAFRTAYFVAGSANDAEDAAQEAFVKAYKALHRFRSGSPFKPWLLAIVTNEARTRIRSATRRGSLELKVARSRPLGDAAPSPEEAALAESDSKRVLDALTRLDDKDRLVIGYRFFLDLSERETAVALGVRPGTVKSRMSRALGRLRAAFEQEAGP